MNINKSKMLLGIGSISLSIIPIISVISCSNDNGTGIPNNVRDKYKNIFSKNKDEYGNYENKLVQSFEDTKATDAKTKEEVQKIAQEKLDNISNKDLQQLLLNSQMKGAKKFSKNELNLIREGVLLYDISDFSYDKVNKEISFTASFYDEAKIIKNKDEMKSSSILKISYNKIKIEANVVEDNNMLFPVIMFSEEQPNASGKVINADFQPYNINNNVLKQMYDNEERLPTQPGEEIKNFDDYVKVFKRMNDYTKESYNKLKNLNDVGKVDGKFTIYNNHWNEEIVISGGWQFGYENNNVESSSVSGGPIFFSTLNKDGSATWEAYQTKLENNTTTKFINLD